jgi:hypothetical protein
MKKIKIQVGQWATGRAQPLNADRPVDRQTRRRAREN